MKNKEITSYGYGIYIFYLQIKTKKLHPMNLWYIYIYFTYEKQRNYDFTCYEKQRNSFC